MKGYFLASHSLLLTHLIATFDMLIRYFSETNAAINSL